MPIIRYTCLVGSFLLGMVFLLGDRETPADSPVPDRWTAVDSLRAMAHLGESVRGAGFAQIERAPPQPDRRNELAELAVRENPVIMNAQANIDLRKTVSQSAAAAAKPRKQKTTNRQIRVRTAIAENTQRMPSDVLPPSW
jgi:hypothetical protein